MIFSVPHIILCLSPNWLVSLISSPSITIFDIKGFIFDRRLSATRQLALIAILVLQVL